MPAPGSPGRGRSYVGAVWSQTQKGQDWQCEELVRPRLACRVQLRTGLWGPGCKSISLALSSRQLPVVRALLGKTLPINLWRGLPDYPKCEAVGLH